MRCSKISSKSFIFGYIILFKKYYIYLSLTINQLIMSKNGRLNFKLKQFINDYNNKSILLFYNQF